MNFEETIEFLEQHVGKTVEVAIEMPIPSRDEPVHLAGFWGQLGRLTKSGASMRSTSGGEATDSSSGE